MNASRVLRLVLTLAIIFLVFSIVWAKFISHSYVSIQLGTADSYLLVAGQDSRLVASGSQAGTHNVPTGDYILSFSQNHTTTDLQRIHVGPFSKQSVEPHNQRAEMGAALLLNRAVQSPVALNGGYLYVNSVDRGVHYLDSAHHDADISKSFGLTTTNTAAGTSPTYDSIVTILPTRDSAVVVTTLGVFQVKSATDITKLVALSDSTGIITGSLDSSTNVLYLLTTAGSTVYSYDMSAPTNAPRSVFKTTKTVNRIVAGGGSLVVYFDAVPNTDTSLLPIYAQKKQLVPLLINVSKKSSMVLSNYTSPTVVSISPTGTFLTIKERFAATMGLYNISQHRVVTSLPAPDAGGIAWQQDLLYIARAGAIWSHNPATNETSLVTKLNITITDLRPNNTGLVAVGTHQLVGVTKGAGVFTPTNTSTEQPLGQTSLYQYYATGQ